MSFIATAVIGSAVIGVGGAYLAGEAQIDAAGQSADATLTTSRESNALTKEMYEQGREDMMPWMVAGENAIKRLEDQPDFKFNAQEFEFMADPGYQFRLQEGIDALDQSAASRGRTQSGAQGKAIAGYAGDMASQEYSNAFNRWQSEESNRYGRELGTYNTNTQQDQFLSGQGQAAAAGVGAAGTNMAATSSANTMAAGRSASNAYLAAGEATAGAYTGAATAINQGIGNYLLM